MSDRRTSHKAAAQSGYRLSRSGLTGRVYLVRRWRDLGEGRIEAMTKVDVTEEYEALRRRDQLDDRYAIVYNGRDDEGAAVSGVR